MKTIIKLEEAGLFILGVYLFVRLDYTWWWFPVLLMAPDFAMLGYAGGNKIGALLYNVFHHRGIAVGVYFAGIYLSNSLLQFAGIILFAHASLDRVLGYGLKYRTGFSHTHLGEIGKQRVDKRPADLSINRET